MIERHAVPIKSIAWVAPDDAGVVDTFYEPESIDELTELCRLFYRQKLPFDLIGHTSNILYTPGYHVERMVSTRKLTHYEILDNGIICSCGSHVRTLANDAVKAGIKDFEGLIDLPGTVAAALYGNAGCFGCSVSELLIDAILLTSDGTVQTVTPDWFHFTKRSSALKRHEKEAVILSATLRNEKGDATTLQKLADENHQKRRASQPGPNNSLGSIFSNSGQPTVLKQHIDSQLTELEQKLINRKANIKEQREETSRMALSLLGHEELQPYVRAWNWYQWNDNAAHSSFWLYVQLHRKMFTQSDFEIEIKGMTPEEIEQRIAESH